MVYFAIVATLLFFVAEIADSGQREVIELDPREVEWRIQQAERAGGTALTNREREAIEAAYIDEEILAREARIRGLDDDERIHSMLSQRMLHALSAEVVQPSEAELRLYYEENRARYVRPPAVAADQVLVKGTGFGNSEVEPSGRAPAKPPPELAAGQGPENLARRDGFEYNALTGVTLTDLSLAFGQQTAARIFGAEVGEWVGPHGTAGGDLWFRITERFESGPPPLFEAILGQVRYDWMGETAETLLEERLAELRARYSVTFVDGGRP